MTKIKILPKVFIVSPVNNLQSNLHHFDHDIWLENKHVKFSRNNSCPMRIQLAEAFFGTIDSIIYDFKQEGFICAPSPYLLGLGIKYPLELREFSSVASMDTVNLMIDKRRNGSVINIRPSLKSESLILDLCPVNKTLNGNGWIPVFVPDGLALS